MADVRGASLEEERQLQRGAQAGKASAQAAAPVAVSQIAERVRQQQPSEEETLQAAQKGTEIAQRDPAAAEQAVQQVTQAATAKLPPEEKAEVEEQIAEDQQTGQVSDVTRAILGFVPIALGFAAGGAAGGAIGAAAGRRALQTLSDEDQRRVLLAGKEAKREQELKLKQIKEKSDTERRKDEIALKQTNSLALLDARSADQKELEALKQANRLVTKKITKKEPKSSQFEAALFGRRLEQAEQIFGELAKTSDATAIDFAIARKLPEFIKPENIKSQEQAERNFVNAVLRRESGAAIAPSEFESARLQYFPQVGDGPQVLAQKRANRAVAFNALKAEAGEAFGQVEGGGPPPTQIDPLAEQFAKTHKIPVDQADRILKERRAAGG